MDKANDPSWTMEERLEHIKEHPPGDALKNVMYGGLIGATVGHTAGVLHGILVDRLKKRDFPKGTVDTRGWWRRHNLSTGTAAAVVGPILPLPGASEVGGSLAGRFIDDPRDGELLVPDRERASVSPEQLAKLPKDLLMNTNPQVLAHLTAKALTPLNRR